MDSADLFGSADLFNEFDNERPSRGNYLLHSEGSKKSGGISKPSKQVAENGSLVQSDCVSDISPINSDDPTIDEKLTSMRDSSNTSEANAGTTKLHSKISELEQQLREYQTQFSKINKILRLITPDKTLPRDDISPGFVVLFLNNEMRKYRQQVDELFTELAKKSASSYMPSSNESCQLIPQCSDIPPLRLSDFSDKSSKCDESTWEKFFTSSYVIGASHYGTYYSVDLLGSPLVNETPELSYGFEPPIFPQMFLNPLKLDVDMSAQPIKCDDEPPQRRGRPNQCCFNCGATEHKLSDCPLPKNRKKINEGLLAFRAASQQIRPPNKRYHAELSTNADGPPPPKRYKPGFISKDLRDALGMEENELPPYIFQMRHLGCLPEYSASLGHPPGYMEDAIIDRHNSLAVFNSEGKEVDENHEPLKADDYSQVMFDFRRIPAWPGFNTQTPPNCPNEPEPSPRHLQLKAIRNLPNVVDKDSYDSELADSNMSLDSSDNMEVSDDEPEIIDNETIAELVARRKQLLQKLEAEDDSLEILDSVGDSDNGNVIDLTADDDADDIASNEATATMVNDNDADETEVKVANDDETLEKVSTSRVELSEIKSEEQSTDVKETDDNSFVVISTPCKTEKEKHNDEDEAERLAINRSQSTISLDSFSMELGTPSIEIKGAEFTARPCAENFNSGIEHISYEMAGYGESAAGSYKAIRHIFQRFKKSINKGLKPKPSIKK